MTRRGVRRQAGACICWEVVAGVAFLLASDLVSLGAPWPDHGLQTALMTALLWCGVACLVYGLIMDSKSFLHALRFWRAPRRQPAACPIRRAPGLLGRDIRDLRPRRRK